MKLAAREDISAPIEAVFLQLSDFDGFERAALRRGAEVVRTDELPVPGAGMAWRTGFDFHGRARKANIELKGYDMPERMLLQVHSSGLEVDLLVDLVAMSRTRTRMSVSLEARPRTIPARLMLQSLKLARQNVLTRFRRKVGEFAIDLEGRCRAS